MEKFAGADYLFNEMQIKRAKAEKTVGSGK
jgi:hypothetical protein